MKKLFSRIQIGNRQLLIILAILCVGLMLVTYSAEGASGPLREVTSLFVTPFQNGINTSGRFLAERASHFADVETLQEENEELRAKVNELTERNNALVQSQSELVRLQNLYTLDNDYAEYTKIAAQVIAKDAGNWYNSFIINRGSLDGVTVDMNVIADGGLVGIVTETGLHWAQVRAIIDDESNISAMVATTSDTCLVSGDLASINSGTIHFSELIDRDDVVTEGTSIVTSNISTKYLTGLLIGYVSEIDQDSNKLTKSGSIIPAADFKHLREVLVIKETKETKESLS